MAWNVVAVLGGGGGGGGVGLWCHSVSDLLPKMSLMMTRNNSQWCFIYVTQMSRVPFVTFGRNLTALPVGLWACLSHWKGSTLKWNMAQAHEKTSKWWQQRTTLAVTTMRTTTSASTSSSIAIKNLCFHRVVCLYVRIYIYICKL